MVPSSGQLTVKQGGSVSMECKASGNPVPSVTWSKKVSKTSRILPRHRKKRIPMTPRTSFNEIPPPLLLFSRRALVLLSGQLFQTHQFKKIVDGAVLTLDKLRMDDAGMYQCTAENGVGKPVSLDMKVDVLCEYIHCRGMCWLGLSQLI